MGYAKSLPRNLLTSKTTHGDFTYSMAASTEWT